MKREFELSPDQRKAVESGAAALVVTASAGCGKTEVVARRIERLLASDAGGTGRVLAVSHTVKAAEEMRERLRQRVGDVDRRVDCETVHRFAHGLLRKGGTWVGLTPEPQLITEDDDRVELLRSWLTAQGDLVDPDDLHTELHAIDLARARRSNAPHLEEWRAALADAGGVDYPAMIDLATELAVLPGTNRQLQRMYDHVVVDEAQNPSQAQYGLLTAIVGPSPVVRPTVMLVGDPKQSIVVFAGADPTLIGRFASDYGAEVVALESNFRSAAKIQRVVDAVGQELGQERRSDDVDHPAPGRIDLRIAATEAMEGYQVADWIESILEHGLPVDSLAPDEDVEVVPEDIAVLGRSAATLREVRIALDRRGIASAIVVRPQDWVTSPFGEAVVNLMTWRAGADFVPRRALAAQLAVEAEALVDLPAALNAMRQVSRAWRSLADVVARGEPQKVVEGLVEVELEAEADHAEVWEADRKQIEDAWDDYCRVTDVPDRSWGGFRFHIARLQRTTDLTDGVRLMTIHKAQGKEFRAVAVVGLNDGQLPDFRNTDDPEGIEAELRAFYVAISRASRVLLLSRAVQRVTRYGTRATTPSRFLELAVT